MDRKINEFKNLSAMIKCLLSNSRILEKINIKLNQLYKYSIKNNAKYNSIVS